MSRISRLATGVRIDVSPPSGLFIRSRTLPTLRRSKVCKPNQRFHPAMTSSTELMRSSLAGLIFCITGLVAHFTVGQEGLLENDVIVLPRPVPPESVMGDPLFEPPDFLSDRRDEDDRLGGRDRLNALSDAERAPFRLFTHYVPSRSVRNSPSNLSAHTVGGQIGVPLRIYTDGIWLATASFQTTELSTSAVLPVSGTPIPDRLWDIRNGMFFSRKLANDWRVSGLFNFGSASDEPYNSSSELTFTALGFINIPARDLDTWDISFFYSPTSPIPFPIPGLAYHWRPNDQFAAQIGLPASLIYSPNDSFVLRARYTPVAEVLVEANQAIDRDWGVFVRYRVGTQNYFLAGRADRELLFTQFEQQIVTGLSFHFENGFTLDLSAGYLFDRRFFLDTGFDLNAKDLIRVESGAILSAQLIWNL